MKSEPSVLRDFTVDRRVWLLSGVSIGIGVCATALAFVLLRCIALSTNLFYYHRFRFASVSPAGSPLGYWMVIVPVIGGLLVGLMARFGSDKIRGHGIPEAIEAILLHRARVDAKVAVLKPISAAIAIGSGGDELALDISGGSEQTATTSAFASPSSACASKCSIRRRSRKPPRASTSG